MGRKNHHALIENQKAKKGKPESATKLNKVKKDKNAFKVTSQNKKVNKKAKQVQKQVQNVKKISPGKGANASEKLNSQLKDLHKDMVVKQPKPAPKKVEKSKGKKQGGPKAKEVADELAKMDV